MSYLLLGEAEPLLAAVEKGLREDGREVYHLERPLVAPQRFSWWLEDGRSQSELWLADGRRLSDADIEGVLLRPGRWLAVEGWVAGEREYAAAETEAALLAWLHGLDCRVINRYTAAQWYGLQANLLDWQASLRQAGLANMDMLITNVMYEGQAVSREQTAVLTPLIGTAHYRIEDEAAWSSLKPLQQLMPLCLTQSYGQSRRCCLVGATVIWDGERIDTVEEGVRGLARLAGLSFIALEFAAAASGWRVADVAIQPQMARFSEAAQGKIAGALVRLLITGQKKAQP